MKFFLLLLLQQQTCFLTPLSVFVCLIIELLGSFLFFFLSPPSLSSFLLHFVSFDKKINNQFFFVNLVLNKRIYINLYGDYKEEKKNEKPKPNCRQTATTTTRHVAQTVKGEQQQSRKGKQKIELRRRVVQDG